MKAILEELNTPKRKRAAAKLQAKLRAEMSGRLAQNPAQANFLYGQGREQMALEQLTSLKAEDYGEIALEDRKTTLQNQMAEGLALQGLYTEAALVSESPAHKAEYQAKAEALKKLNKKTCPCPDVVREPAPTDAKGKEIQTKQMVEIVFNGKKEITLLRCNQCQAISATA